MNYKDCAKELLTHENILIVTHRNPDGDTVASAAALCSALQRGGRRAWMFKNEQIGGKLREFCGRYFAPDDFRSKFVVAVDVADEKLLSFGFSGRVDLCIDHHPTNSHYAAQSLVRADKAACAELVLELIVCMNGALTAEEATLLYIALSTDTGCFQYANTNATAFRAAAELLRMGADNSRINRIFFRQASAARLKLESMIYAGLRFYREGRITVATVTREMLAESGAEEDDLDDLAGLAGRAENSVVSVTIREMAHGSSKISVRSNEEVSSSDICAVFGGGGHAMAAGCTIFGEPDRARELLLNVIDEVWK